MDELEELKRKRLKELQEQNNQDFQQEQQQFEQELAQLENTVRPYMAKEAIERLGTIKIAYPQKAAQSMVMAAQLIQKDPSIRITDGIYKEILRRLSQRKPDFRIKRR